MMLRTPIFIQAGLGKNAQPLEELLTRWNSYGKTLEEVSKGELRKIIIFLPDSNQLLDLERFMHLEVNFFPDSSLGRLRLVNHLSERIKKLGKPSVTLVAGDIYVSPILARGVKFICSGSIRIQIQFHGATYAKRTKGTGSYLRYFLVRLAILYSDSIRIVSAFQKYEIQRLAGRRQKDFVLSPIPISITKIPNSRIPHTGLAILVLGRLHSERGIAKLVELIDLLAYEKVQCTFNIVGDGPQAELLVPYLENPHGSTKVILHGLKSESDVRTYLAQSDILISFAKQEGYGLALREAVLSGVHVIAKRNSGTEEALKAFPGRIDLIKSAPEALKFIKSFKPREVDEGALSELRAIQEHMNTKVVEALVRSWIEI
ncbi:glycosyltransferase [Candidatus Planktophila dulcis]|uniref:glycosyltransferase n=1 Tax=Candidatus Planktophila dulcis TaxID=1884914 RepID=UPI000BACAEAB|nr:glycosyltransferase [Candidatus Planktophila dulcis]ASY14001.1 glycosyltransferase [Candidatus Planktophila dulcis]